MNLKKDQRLQIQFDKDMANWLKTTSEKRRCSIAQIIRDLILAEMDAKKKR
jgi:hypothetical protein